jgi:hypothetical protein
MALSSWLGCVKPAKRHEKHTRPVERCTTPDLGEAEMKSEPRIGQRGEGNLRY